MHEEKSVSNEGENVPVPEEESKIDAPIPAFLSNMTFSNVEEESAKKIEIPNRIATVPDAPLADDKSQKVSKFFAAVKLIFEIFEYK